MDRRKCSSIYSRVLSWLNMYEIRIANCYTMALQQLIQYRCVRINVTPPTHCIYFIQIALHWKYLMTKYFENNLQARSYLTVLLGGLHKYDQKQQLVHTSLDEPVSNSTGYNHCPSSQSVPVIFCVLFFQHNKIIRSFSIPEIMQQRTGNYWQMNR